MLALQTAWLLWLGPTLESRLKNLGYSHEEDKDKDKDKEKNERSLQVRSRIWLAVSEASSKPEAFLIPEFRHLFKVHVTLFLVIIIVIILQ